MAAVLAAWPRTFLDRFPHVQVTGLHLSRVQTNWIREKQGEPEHPLGSKRFQLIEEDFNTAKITGRYDRSVSLGFFEHIGNLGQALARISKALVPDGLCFLHYITRQETLGAVKDPRSSTFFERYIVPGWHVWPFHVCAAMFRMENGKYFGLGQYLLTRA